ncbi:MAG TPA: cytochrome P450 [Ktedonobacteraceae bacterium]|nr:cytochrome P450 [Ktedonobacteraceae bacterium]
MPEPIVQTEQATTKATSTSSQHKSPPRLRSHGLLGSASEMQRDPLKFLRETRQYGDVVRMRFVFSDAYLIYHPDSVKHVLQENNRNYNKDIFTYKIFLPFLGRGLLTNDGESWLHQRRLMQPAFHRKRIATYSTIMTDATVALLERWQSNVQQDSSLDIAKEMMRLTLGIVGQTLFSLDLSDETNTIGPAVTTMLNLLGNYVYAPFPPINIPTSRNRRLLAANRSLEQVIYHMIAERRRQNIDTGDLLSMLLAARDEETGEGMNDRQIRDELMTMLTAGHETTANALAWTWYLLSQHPEVEQRLYREIDEVLGRSIPTLEHLPELKYTNMVLEEALRLYPPAGIFGRKAIADDELQGYHIPANSMIVMSPYATQHHPDYWPDPERFDPERFTPERSADRSHYAYFPFSSGPRMCIGSSFAMMEAQLILATIAQRYQLRMVPGHPVEPQLLVTLRPKYGLQMTLHER